MELALYCPDCGYYEKENDRLGRRGDFYTSVSVGPLFGALLAFQFAEWLSKLSIPRPQLIEAGAHDGRLALDILTWLQQWRPELFQDLEYVFLESSERRKQWQRETVKAFADKVRWRSDVHDFTGIIFANELLDALPVHRLGWDAQRKSWFEWGVSVLGNQFEWRRMQESDVLKPTFPLQTLTGLPQELLDALPNDFTTEVCPAAKRWWSNAATGLRRGWLMTLDYGQTSAERLAPHRPDGTLRAYRGHKLNDHLLADPGEQDLTAHVNFDSLRAAGETAGLNTAMFTTQANFLAEIMKRFWPEAESRGAWSHERAREFQTLVHPEHLGRAFRVLAQTR